MRRNDSINRGGRFFSTLSHSRMAVLIERLLGILIPVVDLVPVAAIYSRRLQLVDAIESIPPLRSHTPGSSH
jgi:hypothetical protein